MRIIITILYLFSLSQFILSLSINTKPNITLDEFFDYTTYPLLSISPTNKNLLIQTRHSSWINNTYVYSLWIYNIQNQIKTLITNKLHPSIKPKWSPSGNWIVLSLNNKDQQNNTQSEQCIYLYSIVLNELIPIRIENEIPLIFTWSKNDSSLYIVTINSLLNNTNHNVDDEWKDVIQYRKNRFNKNYTISKINFNENNFLEPMKKFFIRNISFPITELLYVPEIEKLVFTSVSTIMENLDDFEIYSIDLQNPILLSKLTENEAIEEDLQLSSDGKQVFFRVVSLCSTKKKSNDSQGRLYSIDLTNGQITQYAKKFFGNIIGYTLKSDGNIYILGQLGTEIHIYTQLLSNENLIYHNGWNGTYENLIISNNNSNILAFVHSSLAKPMEVYLIENIDQLSFAQPITNNNQLYTQRNLPLAKVYSWKNEDDNQIIEGLLHYPPGKYEGKNLPLLVLIHGGPYAASVNRLLNNGGNWAPLAASQGWLVLEPNYRGSTGYGDEFLNQIRSRPLSLTGKDILSGVNSLIKDGIVDSHRLTVGGYSYGGFLTNWLITQTKRFNAALSGSGAVDHTSTWGTLDVPALIENLFGGFPWNVPHKYQDESPIYQLDRVRTPTLIVTGEIDVRVPASQSYMLERALYYRGIPVQLLVFPNEGHSLSYNPWHGKIKVREELKWLHKYGNQPILA